MSTEKFLISQEPTQISDGSSSVYVQQIRGGLLRFCCEVSKPTDLTKYAQMLNNDISVAQGFPLWVWSFGNEPVEIIVLKSENM